MIGGSCTSLRCSHSSGGLHESDCLLREAIGQLIWGVLSTTTRPSIGDGGRMKLSGLWAVYVLGMGKS